MPGRVPEERRLVVPGPRVSALEASWRLEARAVWRASVAPVAWPVVESRAAVPVSAARRVMQERKVQEVSPEAARHRGESRARPVR